MNKRTKLIIATSIIIVFAIVATLYLTLSKNASTPARKAVTTTPPTISPSAPPSSTETEIQQVYEEDIQTFEARYPAASHLPEVTPYWVLEPGGDVENDKLPIRATIFIRPDQDQQEQIERQQGFIEEWLTSVRQPSGTYTLQITTEPAHTY